MDPVPDPVEDVIFLGFSITDLANMLYPELLLQITENAETISNLSSQNDDLRRKLAESDDARDRALASLHPGRDRYSFFLFFNFHFLQHF